MCTHVHVLCAYTNASCRIRTLWLEIYTCGIHMFVSLCVPPRTLYCIKLLLARTLSQSGRCTVLRRFEDLPTHLLPRTVLRPAFAQPNRQNSLQLIECDSFPRTTKSPSTHQPLKNLLLTNPMAIAVAGTESTRVL